MQAANVLACIGTNPTNTNTVRHCSGGLSVAAARWRATTRSFTPGWTRIQEPLDHGDRLGVRVHGIDGIELGVWVSRTRRTGTPVTGARRRAASCGRIHGRRRVGYDTFAPSR